MFSDKVRCAVCSRGALAALLLAVAHTGCAGWERDRYPHEYATVAPSAECQVYADGVTGVPLDGLGGYHATRWHTIEPAMMQPSAVGAFLPGPVLVPQEEVPIPEPDATLPEKGEEKEDSVRPDILPGIRSSMNPARDNQLTQTAWPVVMASEGRGVVRLPAVADVGRTAEARRSRSSVAIDTGPVGAQEKPRWWRYGPLASRPASQERVAGPLRR